MPKRKVGALEKVDADLANLQSKIRRDPRSYRDEFNGQYSQYATQRDIYMQAPGSVNSSGIVSLRDLIDFISHVADCYKDVTTSFPEDLMQLLRLHHAELEPELREKIVGSLVLLKRKDIVDSSTLLHTLFPILITTTSKSLRALLFQKILSDLRTSNSKTTNHKLNRTIQTVLYNLLTADRTSSKGLWAVKITRELWKRQIWTDSKAVEIMKEASLADNEKVIMGGVRFFLGGDKEREELDDESSDEEDVDIGKIKHQVGINKKSKKKVKQLDKAVATIKKKERKKKQPHPLNFSALHLLHDPQGFAETLFSKHLQNPKSKLNLEQKLLTLQLVSRLVGLHKLTIISLYSYFIKYLTPRQPSVTSFLASLAQATHTLVPPDVLEPLVQKIANEFVSEAAASEVASAGLNAIREICVRQPLAMNDTLLQDLVLYRKSKDKGVMMAAKGLLGLYREVGAELLRKRDRGKAAAMGVQSGERKERRFGEEEVGRIEGLELLDAWKKEERRKKRVEEGLPAEGGTDDEDALAAEGAEDEDWNAWDVEDDNSDDSGGWINVDSSDELDIDIASDSDADSPVIKKAKLSTANTPKPSTNPTTTKDPLPPPSTLAQTRILTPADLSKLHELRLAATLSSTLPKSHPPPRAVHHPDNPLLPTDLTALATLHTRPTKDSKLALAAAGKSERLTHQSIQARRQLKKQEQGKSSTNQEKARKKNFLMTLGKARGKKRRSLVEQRRVLRGHVERRKRGGRRGNVGM